MSYNITKTNGQTLLSLADGTIDTSTGLFLVGKNYRGYGEFIADNFVRLAENLANGTPPTSPLAGQLWFNTTTLSLNVFNGTAFKQVASLSPTATAPATPSQGDMWLDTTVNQVKVYIGTSWMLLGPQAPKNAENSGWIVTFVTDNTNQSHIVNEILVNGVVVGIVSGDTSPFTLQTPIGGFTTINPGMNIPPGYMYTGQATDSAALAGIPANTYMRKDIDQITLGSVSVQNNSGLNVGQLNDMSLIVGPEGPAIVANNGQLTLGTGSHVGLYIDPTVGEVRIPNAPVTTTGAANKIYVDNNITATQLAGQTYTDSAISALRGAAPSGLNTLAKIAASINNDPAYSTSVNGLLAGKANTVDAILTGNPTVPTRPTGDSSSSIASTAFVINELGNVVRTQDLADYYHGASPFFRGIATMESNPAVSDNSQNLVTTSWIQELFVKGMVMIWPFPANTVPAGWAPCDGNVYSGTQTPDLRNYFLVGAGNSYTAGQTGGTLSNTPTIMPAGSHSHGSQTAITVLTINQMPVHTHTYLDCYFSEAQFGPGNYPGSKAGLDFDNNPFNFQLSRVTDPAGGGEGHYHGIYPDGTHTHAATPGDNRPPFYAVTFIMKVV